METWETLMTNIKEFVGQTLKLTASIELDGETGINEQAFKLVVLAYLSMHQDRYEIESERQVEGGRIDILIRRIDEPDDVLMIELKYVRAGYLELSRMPSSTPPTKKYAIYNSVDEKVSRMDYKDLLLVINRRYNKTPPSETIANIIDGACEQNKRYEKSLKMGSIRPLKNSSIHSVVLIGICRRVISTDVYRRENISVDRIDLTTTCTTNGDGA
jgi:hypothetical protein